jgi:hypothetical protein
MMERYLSLGAGVQSSTLALMIAHGEIPMVNAAIFADTGWEPRKVYDWLDWLEKQLPFPVYRVASGNLRNDIIAATNNTGKTFRSVPWHLLKPNGETAMNSRQCTAEYKIKPVHRKLRELMGYASRKRIPANSCQMLMGISLDEVFRMKPSWHKWLVHQWPLIDAGMARHDCLSWMERKGYPSPPKSSCIGCPFHNNDEWRNIKTDSEAWEDAVMLDKLIRTPQHGFKSQQFMHRDRVPLDEVDLSTAADHGQVDMFNNECEGMCGI